MWCRPPVTCTTSGNAGDPHDRTRSHQAPTPPPTRPGHNPQPTVPHPKASTALLTVWLVTTHACQDQGRQHRRAWLPNPCPARVVNTERTGAISSLVPVNEPVTHWEPARKRGVGVVEGPCVGDEALLESVIDTPTAPDGRTPANPPVAPRWCPWTTAARRNPHTPAGAVSGHAPPTDLMVRRRRRQRRQRRQRLNQPTTPKHAKDPDPPGATSDLVSNTPILEAPPISSRTHSPLKSEEPYNRRSRRRSRGGPGRGSRTGAGGRVLVSGWRRTTRRRVVPAVTDPAN